MACEPCSRGHPGDATRVCLHASVSRFAERSDYRLMVNNASRSSSAKRGHCSKLRAVPKAFGLKSVHRQRHFFDLTPATETSSCRPRCLNQGHAWKHHARKPRSRYLDDLLSECPHWSFRLRRPSLLHHLSLSQKQKARAGPGPAL